MVLFKFIFARLIPVRFWMYGLYLLCLTGCSTYVGDFWTGFLTFTIGFPIWIVVGIVLIYKELQSLRKEVFESMTGSDDKTQRDNEVLSDSVITALSLAITALNRRQKKRP